MQLTTGILLVFCLSVSAKTISQTITFSGKNVPMEKVFSVVEQQTGYTFLGKKETLRQLGAVTVDVKDLDLKDFLKQILSDRPYDFEIAGKSIFIKRKPQAINIIPEFQVQPPPITGIIRGPNGQPLAGVNVVVKGTKKGVSTGSDGKFSIEASFGEVLIISSIGYSTKEVKVTNNNVVAATLELNSSPLDDIQIIGYGKTSKRLNTGSVSKVTAKEISIQPVANPLAALQGKVPGMTVTQTTGVSGGGFNVQIRSSAKMNGITIFAPPQAVQPLFIIDGIPYSNELVGGNSGTIGSAGFVFSAGIANQGQSPFASINPADIESIEILKDADATSIYGSRGANGVVLITTKKGKAGKQLFDVNYSTGIGRVSRFMDYMNTQQYLDMRKEAFNNDNRMPTVSTAPDLLAWDSTRYIDWQKLLIGGTANYTDANASLSGGNGTTHYLLSAGYHKETTVFPGDFTDTRGTMHLNLTHGSQNRSFLISVSSTISLDNNKLPTEDITGFITVSPNAPYPIDEGKLVWSENGGINTRNPFSNLFQRSNALATTFINNINLHYQLGRHLQIRANIGTTFQFMNERRISPLSSKNPTTNPTGSLTSINSQIKSWIIEPQIDYNKRVWIGDLSILGGTTFQQSKSEQMAIDATGYTNDALIEFIGAAPLIQSANYMTDYKYQGTFARINYNIDNKYLINLTGRRDGSSRFGPEHRFENFAAVGVGWIFSEEKLFKSRSLFFSFGKIRGSYGTSGSDNIGDYQYFDNFMPTTYNYQGINGLVSSSLFNPAFSWERSKKFEVALELGFIKDRILLTANYYNTKNDNLLVNYSIPDQVGFASILSNFNAVVQNNGIEIDLNSINVKKINFQWQSNFNISIPKSKLTQFPDLKSSSYASKLEIGYPLEIRKVLPVTGVNPETGIYEFGSDANKVIDITPEFFGGFSNTITYKNFEFHFLFQYRKQIGFNYLTVPGTITPGSLVNQPVEVLERWRKPGDVTPIQKFATTGPANIAFNTYKEQSEARNTDASFIRLKNAAFSYSLPPTIARKVKLRTTRIYLQGQNLLLITNYKGLDPETNFSGTISLPALQVLTVGMQIQL